MSKAVLLACLLAAASGCRNACLALADAVCSCELDQATKDNCNAQAKTQGSTFPVTSEDEKFCQQKLDANACSCTALNTPEGRAACGLVVGSP